VVDEYVPLLYEVVHTEEIALEETILVDTWLAVVEVVEFPLTSWPTPQGIASPSGWVL